MSTNVKVLQTGVVTWAVLGIVPIYAPASPTTALISGITFYNGSAASLEMQLSTGGTGLPIFFHRVTLAAGATSVMADVVTIGAGQQLNANLNVANATGVTYVIFGIERG